MKRRVRASNRGRQVERRIGDLLTTEVSQPESQSLLLLLLLLLPVEPSKLGVEPDRNVLMLLII